MDDDTDIDIVDLKADLADAVDKVLTEHHQSMKDIAFDWNPYRLVMDIFVELVGPDDDQDDDDDDDDDDQDDDD